METSFNPGFGAQQAFGAGYPDPSAYGQFAGIYGQQQQAAGGAQVSQLDNIMMAFLSQEGVTGADGMLDKAKFQKMINDAKSLQNQLDASTWSTMKQMADSWAR